MISLTFCTFLPRQFPLPSPDSTLNEVYLERNSPRYIGEMPEMLNAQLFKYWNDLPEALRTGKPQNEIKHGGKNIFDELYADPEKLEFFLDGMAGLSRISFEAVADKFDFSRYHSLCDIGGPTGLLCIEVAKKYPHFECISFDLPPVEPVAKKHIAAAGLLVGSAQRAAISFRTRCRRLT